MITNTNKPVLLLMPPQQAAHSDIKSIAIRFLQRLRPHLTRRNVLIAGGSVFALLSISYSAAFLLPRTVNFSYAGNNCFINPVLLPSLVGKDSSPTFVAAPVASLAVAGYPLFSGTTCVTPTQPPKANMSETIPFGAGLFKKNIKVSAGAFPSLKSEAILEKPISTQDPLVLVLTTRDKIFEYQLLAGDKTVACPAQDSTIACDVTGLQLAQSVTYDFKLERLFHGKPAGTIFARSIATVETVTVAASSIAIGQTIYDIPEGFTLTLNRPAISIDGAQLFILNGSERTAVPSDSTLNENTITVKFAQPLARSASFVYTVQHITAEDGGYLAVPYELPFKTSGGPKVLGLSIGSYKIPVTSSIIITFDSAPLKAQNLSDFIKLEAGGNAVAATVTANNNTITIRPSANLPRCTPLTVKVLDGLKNTSGITGGSAWQTKSRTICQTTFSIGTSVQGRSILAYSFGSGASKIIYVGATHGDEKSSAYLLNSWIDYIEAQGGVPANRTVIVIPILNPDGYAANKRTNANNVDLNRNFPVSNWKSAVTMPDKSYNPSGGGSSPLSEPESSALASYILAISPRLVLTYHATAGLVIPNGSGDSVALALSYDQKSNVYFADNNQTSEIFEYDTTGAFEDWLHESPGISALLIELWNMSGNEFARHQNAMWATAQLP